MALETWGPGSRVPDLNLNWPTYNDALNQGDDHIRLIKTVLSNLYNDLTDGTVQVADAAHADEADHAAEADAATLAENTSNVGSIAASNVAARDGTYPNLRAQATTKDDVGLGSVNNYGISDSTSLNSSTTYASSKAVRDSTFVAGSVDSLGGVGSYGMMAYTVSAEAGPGTTTSGSNLRWSSADGQVPGAGTLAPSGTWRCHGRANGGASSNGESRITVWIRIA